MKEKMKQSCYRFFFCNIRILRTKINDGVFFRVMIFKDLWVLIQHEKETKLRSYSFLFVFEYCCELEWFWLFIEEDGIYFVFSYYENWSNCESRTPQCGCRCLGKGFIYSWIICVSYGYERTICNLLCSVTPSLWTFNTQIYELCNSIEWIEYRFYVVIFDFSSYFGMHTHVCTVLLVVHNPPCTLN